MAYLLRVGLERILEAVFCRSAFQDSDFGERIGGGPAVIEGKDGSLSIRGCEGNGVLMRDSLSGGRPRCAC